MIVPEGWRYLSLRHLAKINYGKSPVGMLADDGAYPVVGTGGTERFGDDYLYDGESIILGRKGSIDRVYFTRGKIWVIDTAYYLSEFKGATPRWLYFLLQTVNLRGLNEATGVPSLSRDRLYEIEVLTPPENEQFSIAEVLEGMDRAIAQADALILKQQRILRGLSQDLLTVGIDEYGVVRSEVTHEFGDSKLGPVPKDWRIATLGELFERRRERGRPGLPVMSIVMKDGLVARSSVERRVESNLSPEAHALVVKGDIAYNMMRMWQGVLGRAEYDCLVSPAYVVLKPRDSIDTRFAEWMFRDRGAIRKFRRSSRGVVDDRLRLYAADLLSIEFALPRSIEEQRAIADRLDGIKADVDKAAAVVDKYRRLRSGLLRDLLTGKRRVTPLINDV